MLLLGDFSLFNCMRPEDRYPRDLLPKIEASDPFLAIYLCSLYYSTFLRFNVSLVVADFLLRCVVFSLSPGVFFVLLLAPLVGDNRDFNGLEHLTPDE